MVIIENIQEMFYDNLISSRQCQWTIELGQTRSVKSDSCVILIIISTFSNTRIDDEDVFWKMLQNAKIMMDPYGKMHLESMA